MKRAKLMPFFLLIVFTISILSGCAPALLSQESPSAQGERGFGGEVVSDAFEPEAPAEERASTGDENIPGDERLVIKNAEISIIVDDPAQSMDAVAEMAEEMGGFVVSSNLFFRRLEGGAEVPQANITIRVPAEQLDNAVSQIEAGAGRVLSKNISGEDVTQEYTDLQSRLRNLEAAEARLLEILDSANRTEDVLNVHRELTNIQEQIEVIQGRIQFFEQSVAFSAISVQIMADAAVQPLTIGGWQPVGVAKDAIQALINTLQGIAYAIIWIILFVMPVAVVLFIPIYLLWRGFRRWRGRRKAQRARETTGPPTAPEE